MESQGHCFSVSEIQFIRACCQPMTLQRAVNNSMHTRHFRTRHAAHTRVNTAPASATDHANSFDRTRTCIKECRDPGSNRGPSDLRSDALPTELSRLSRWGDRLVIPSAPCRHIVIIQHMCSSCRSSSRSTYIRSPTKPAARCAYFATWERIVACAPGSTC